MSDIEVPTILPGDLVRTPASVGDGIATVRGIITDADGTEVLKTSHAFMLNGKRVTSTFYWKRDSCRRYIRKGE